MYVLTFIDINYYATGTVSCQRPQMYHSQKQEMSKLSHQYVYERKHVL